MSNISRAEVDQPTNPANDPQAHGFSQGELIAAYRADPSFPSPVNLPDAQHWVWDMKKVRAYVKRKAGRRNTVAAVIGLRKDHGI
jgi:hypothetical protein